MKKAVMIVNPHSGKATFRKKNRLINLEIFRPIFEEYDYEVEFIKTKYPNHAREIVRELDYVDLVISVGGDGTYNEVMTGNFERDEKLVLSHLPYGTTNDVGAMFGLGKNIEKNLQLILSGQVCGIDICTINGKPFTYSAGFGKFMNVPYETSRKMKKTIGHLAYLVEGIRDFFQQKTPLYELTYEVNGERYHGLYSFSLLSNANRIAGFSNFYHNIKLNDKKFEVLFCNLTTKKDIVKSLIYLTTNDITKVPGFYFHKTDRLHITFHDKLKKPWCLDGEKFDSNISDYVVEIVQNVPIMIPKKVIPKLFVSGVDKSD